MQNLIFRSGILCYHYWRCALTLEVWSVCNMHYFTITWTTCWWNLNKIVSCWCHFRSRSCDVNNCLMLKFYWLKDYHLSLFQKLWKSDMYYQDKSCIKHRLNQSSRKLNVAFIQFREFYLGIQCFFFLFFIFFLFNLVYSLWNMHTPKHPTWFCIPGAGIFRISHRHA